jgi:hypothetical protein
VGQQELLLTIGAIIVFGLSMVSTNMLMVEQTEAIYRQQAELYALSIAQGYIEEAKTKAFDEWSINTVVASPNVFTMPANSGPGEIYPAVDDIDDLIIAPSDTMTNIGQMSVNLSFNYVDFGDLETAVGYKTYYKKMTVSVFNEYLVDTVKVDYIFAYQKN